MPDTKDPVVSCPICSGPLSAERKTWTCEVGHTFDFAQLAKGQAEACARALWYALRSLEDRAISSRFAATGYQESGHNRQADLMLSQSVNDLVMVGQLHVLLKEMHADDRTHTSHRAAVSHHEPPGQGSHTADPD